MSNIGTGPKGIKIGRITVKNLEPKILELVNNSLTIRVIPVDYVEFSASER